MKIQLIRNATMKITYAGRTILSDPMLAPKGDFKSFAGIARNPTIERILVGPNQLIENQRNKCKDRGRLVS